MATLRGARDHVLTINAGSSSLKAGVFALDPRDAPRDARAAAATTTETSEAWLVSAEIERIGSGDGDAHGGTLRVAAADGRANPMQTVAAADHAAALDLVLAAIERQLHRDGSSASPGSPVPAPFAAVAHRVVHGGSRYSAPQRVDRELLDELRRLIPIDPNHLPQALSLIERIAQRHPDVPQIACFDTAFHRSLPRVAQMYALPPRFWEAGVRRYGFHGLSCEFILESLRTIDPAAAAGRVIIAHLGNGASLTAVRHEKSVETTMGFSPAGGLVMGTRLGDVDPSVLLYAAQQEHASPEALSRLVNTESGLQGVSQTSHDMRDLLVREATDPHAADAVALFCHTARKHLGALTAVLGGLDTLIFTGGIGEHAAPIRERLCADLAFLGVAIDPDRNRDHAAIISRDGASATVRVMKTDEDRMLARHAERVLQSHTSQPRA
jgi:acetate kinase